jgi:isoleucyl-tRNA synthetase
VLLTHGFVLDEDGRKMSKSLGNVIPPQHIMQQSGADILRLWVVGSDYTEDVRIGPEILKRHSDAYRRLRNTLRYLLGALDGYTAAEAVGIEAMPELDRWVLHPLGGARRSRPAFSRGIRLPRHVRRIAQFLCDRTVGLLLRHPQGPALLRRAGRHSPAGCTIWCAGWPR